jgi:glucose/arabinose dehydrogenase
VTTAVGGLDHPWDLGFAPDGTMLYTERAGRIGAVVDGAKRVLASPADLFAAEETGMLGLAIDPAFSSNRYLYTCFASTRPGGVGDVRVVRWTVDAGYTALTDRTDIVTGLPVNASGRRGRHSGCRPRFGPDGYLWVGTGDAGTGTNAQDPRSLGGKVLRVDRTGAAAPGNLEGEFDPRIYSTGHRNVQGLAFRSSDGLGVSLEHGPDRDDELNRLVTGNFGWDPVPVGGGSGYDESGPMTDIQKFPSAIGAMWSSGSPTVAPSGATFLSGARWRAWNGGVAVTMLKGQVLYVFVIDGAGRPQDGGAGLRGYGRLRSAVQGPDGDLYVSTDNGGGNDRILRVVPAP